MTEKIRSIDWNAAWQEAQQACSRPAREASFWDSRASSFAAHARHKSDYPEQFIEIVRPEPHWHVLDVGCGPGTVAIPMAERVASVTALDFSGAMLNILQTACDENNISNIRPVLADWNDDWRAKGVDTHDVVFASRSLVCGDLTAGLVKLNRFTAKRVYISHLVGEGPFDSRIIEASGRSFQPCPDYIYVLNLLYQLGIYASVDFTTHPVNRTFDDIDDALDECRWMIQDITPAEEQRLKAFFEKNLIFEENNRWKLPGMKPVRWAVIWWDTQ
ncbi:MAG: class I SAM-dependent methyltransferase [Thermodesulfobacteriota bacterium]|nr:class I SAM-dependent methyltransferase [Thermodesulfobacteriota bacterium]